MPTLTVPIPLLEYQDLGAGLTLLEQPIKVQSPPVTLPSGAAFEPKHLGTAGYFVYCQRSATVLQIWDEASKEWLPDPGDDVTFLKPLSFTFDPRSGSPWQALLVAMGRKDQLGKDQFEKVNGSYPHYVVRTYLATTVGGVALAGLSAPSTAIRFTSTVDQMLAGICVGNNETPATATEVLLFLRDGSLQPIGAYEIHRFPSGTELVISNRSSGARIRLLPTGDVEIQPGPGGALRVNGVIQYQPANASGAPVGPIRWLV